MVGELLDPLECGAPPIAVELVRHGVVAVHAVQPGLAALRVMGELFLRQFLEAAVDLELLVEVVLFWAVPLACPPGVLPMEALLVVSDKVPVAEQK